MAAVPRRRVVLGVELVIPQKVQQGAPALSGSVVLTAFVGVFLSVILTPGTIAPEWSSPSPAMSP